MRARWLQRVGCFFLFSFFSPLLLSQNMHSDPLFLCLQWESPSLHMTSHSPPSVSSVFQLPLLFGLIAQRGDQGLNIDSRGESPCVLKQFFVCLPCYPLVPHVPPRPSALSLSLSVGGFLFLTQILERSLPTCREQIYLLYSQDMWGNRVLSEGKTELIHECRIRKTQHHNGCSFVSLNLFAVYVFLHLNSSLFCTNLI